MKMIIMKMMVNNEMNKLKLNEFIQLKLKFTKSWIKRIG